MPLPRARRLSRAESTCWAVTVAPLLGMPWVLYVLISGANRTVGVWILLIALIAVFVLGVTGLRRLKQRGS